MDIFLVRFLFDAPRIGFKLAWGRATENKKYEKWVGIKKARLERIDKEINGWPTDPVERAKCPRLKLQYDSQFECNGYIKDAQTSLIYVANEECPELEDFFENHIDKLNRWAKRLNLQIVYLPTLFKSLHDKEVQKYRMPWTDDIKNEDIAVGNDYMFRFLIHPEDKERMKHGFFYCQAVYDYKHYVDTYISHYYELLPPSEKPLKVQLKGIRQKLSDEAALWGGGYFRTVEDIAGDEPEDYADNQFNAQVWNEDIDDLVAEIRERVEKLRQRGVAEMLLMELIRPQEKLSKLVITKQNRIFLPDYQNMEIEMEPLVKAVYLLFLKHPEGIRFKDLPDHREELTEIYLRLKPNGLTDRVKKSIEDVTNPLLNSINEKCARIRGAFVGRFDNSLAQHYYINGLRAEAKKIKLPRDMVTWE